MSTNANTAYGLKTSGQSSFGPAGRRDNVDETHLGREYRFVSMGPLPKGLVSVVWTEPREGVVRIISARWATKRERRRYREEIDQEL